MIGETEGIRPYTYQPGILEQKGINKTEAGAPAEGEEVAAGEDEQDELDYSKELEKLEEELKKKGDIEALEAFRKRLLDAITGASQKPTHGPGKKKAVNAVTGASHKR